MPDDVPEVVLAEAALDAVAEGASASEVWRGTFGVGAYALAAVAAQRAGGGGGASFPDEWTVGDEGTLNIAPSDQLVDPAFKITMPDVQGLALVVDGSAMPTGAVLLNLIGPGNDARLSYDTDGSLYLTDVANGDIFIAFTGAGEIGFFGATPVTQPEIPATPNAQDIADVLVALGLATQAA